MGRIGHARHKPFGLVLMLWIGMGLTGRQPPRVRPGAEALRAAIFASWYLFPAVLIVCHTIKAALP